MIPDIFLGSNHVSIFAITPESFFPSFNYSMQNNKDSLNYINDI